MSDAPANEQLSFEQLETLRRKVPPGLLEGLEHRRQMFVLYLIADPTLTHAAAAEMAGATKRRNKQTAHEWLKDPRVQEALTAARQSIAETATLDAAYVLRRLGENDQAAFREKDYGASNGALSLLGKALGVYVDRVKIDFRDVRELSDEELDEQARTLGLS